MLKVLKLALAAVVLFVTVSSLAPAHAASDDAVITVTWGPDSTSVIVTSTKDISNVVLADCAGAHYKHDGLSGLVGTFEHPDGEAIVFVWVKSGNNKSGDGPGYGQKFTNPDRTVCDEEETATTVVPPTTILTVPPTTTTTTGAPETTTTTSEVVPGPAPVEPAPLSEARRTTDALPHTGINAPLAMIGAVAGLVGLALLLMSALVRRRNLMP